jgi:hypothetical protein
LPGKNLTPVDTREQVFLGAAGVTKNEKNPGFSGVFRVFLI